MVINILDYWVGLNLADQDYFEYSSRDVRV